MTEQLTELTKLVLGHLENTYGPIDSLVKPRGLNWKQVHHEAVLAVIVYGMAKARGCAISAEKTTKLNRNVLRSRGGQHYKRLVELRGNILDIKQYVKSIGM